jgi:hypothetical protein
MKTCPYCASVIQQPMFEEDKCFCGYCNAYVHCSENGKRKSRYERRVIGHEFMYMDLPELMELHTHDLLIALKIAREERRSYFGNMSTVKKAAAQSQDFKAQASEAGNEYEKVTRKVFQIENILLERIGYIPQTVSEKLLLNVLKKCTSPRNKRVMNIKKCEVAG